MQCPYCEEANLNAEEISIHILKGHPEKTQVKLYELMGKNYAEQRVNRIWDTAAGLAQNVYMDAPKSKKTKEFLLDTFKYFLRELMQSE